MFSYRKLNGEAPSKFHQTWLIPMVWARNKRLWSVVQSSTGSNAISTLYGKYINKRRFFLIWHKIEIFCDSNQKCKICRSTWIQTNSWIPIVHISFVWKILICKRIYWLKHYSEVLSPIHISKSFAFIICHEHESLNHFNLFSSNSRSSTFKLSCRTSTYSTRFLIDMDIPTTTISFPSIWLALMKNFYWFLYLLKI